MKKLRNPKNFTGFITLIIILIIFIMGFFSLSNFYLYKNKGSYTVTLDKKLFDVKTSNSENSLLTVDKITKFTIPYILSTYDFLDINTITFTGFDPSSKTPSSKAGIYNMNKNAFTYEFEREKGILPGTIHVSMNGKMILASYLASSGKKNQNQYETCVYDVSEKKIIKTFDNVRNALWLPDSSGFVGIDNYLFVQDMETNKRKDLLSLRKINTVSAKNGVKIKISKDGTLICLKYNNNAAIVNIKTGEFIPMYFPDLFSVNSVSDKDVIITGAVNDDYGLYIYDFKDKLYKKVSGSEKFVSVDISPDGKKIAYNVINNNGISEIHAAYLSNDGLLNDTVIYRTSQSTIYLRWTKDSQMLNCIIQNKLASVITSESKNAYSFSKLLNINSTSIYRISFKNL